MTKGIPAQQLPSVHWYNSPVDALADNKQKSLGQVFTPSWVVSLMLDLSDYKGEAILHRRVFEPCFGNGAFLLEVVGRYIKTAKQHRWTTSDIKRGLEENIFGVEIDRDLVDECLNKLDRLAFENGVENVDWKLANDDALCVDLQTQFDLVVGNPPYIKIHHLATEKRRFLKRRYQFCGKGMIDMYLAFFELGLRQLSPTGLLTYITPNMFMRNTSNQDFRDFLVERRLLKRLIDFKSERIFEKVNTYNCISQMGFAARQDTFDYCEFDGGAVRKRNTFNHVDFHRRRFVFGSPEEMDFLREKNSGARLADISNIQYGLCTLRDKVFISKNVIDQGEPTCLFNGMPIERSILKGIRKASRIHDTGYKLIFPYEQNRGRWGVIPEATMKEKYPLAYAYLLKHKEDLLRRDIDKGALWYEFGRNQGLQTIHKKKLMVDVLVNGKVNLELLDEETMVYSGIFITSERLDLVKRTLEKEDFYRYVKLFGKDLQNNYKSITTKMIKQYSCA